MRSSGTLLKAMIALALGALVGPSLRAAEPTGEAVATTYADIAEATYEDALLTERDLQAAVDGFLAAPGAATHQAA